MGQGDRERMIDTKLLIDGALALMCLINLRHIIKLRREIEELRNYMGGLVTANILEGLKVSDKEIKEKFAEIWDVEE